jgi:hypothetical protein
MPRNSAGIATAASRRTGNRGMIAAVRDAGSARHFDIATELLVLKWFSARWTIEGHEGPPKSYITGAALSASLVQA